MKIYTLSQARAQLTRILDEAKSEPVIIRRRKGDSFSIVPQNPLRSPFDVPGLQTKVSRNEILDALRESRKPR